MGSLAKSSIVYTLVFMAAAAVMVFVWNLINGGRGAVVMRIFLVFLAGLLFGAGLVLSGMTDPAKVIGFLDFAGAWDPALAFVMGGAVLTFGVGRLLLAKSKGRAITIPAVSQERISKRKLIGSTIFGLGWGLGGFCPGPALANLSVLKTEALVFVPLMLLGMFAAQRVFNVDR